MLPVFRLADRGGRDRHTQPLIQLVNPPGSTPQYGALKAPPVPPNIAEAEVILVDPMLATGNSSADAAGRLIGNGAERLHFLSLISAPEGIAHFQELHPDIPIHTAAVDDGLNEKGYIIPGLGDAGDRYFGTV